MELVRTIILLLAGAMLFSMFLGLLEHFGIFDTYDVGEHHLVVTVVNGHQSISLVLSTISTEPSPISAEPA